MSVRGVRSAGRIIYGDVVITNVSHALNTFAETLGIAADGLSRNSQPVTPIGGFGVGLDDQQIRLAPGASTQPSTSCRRSPAPEPRFRPATTPPGST
jgi:hypothetical protein